MKITKTGIYTDLPNDDYRSQTEWISISELNMLRDPHEYYMRLATGIKEPATEAMNEGTMLHAAAYEAWKLPNEFMKGPPGPFNSNAAKQAWVDAEQLAAKEKKILIDAKAYDRILDAASELNKNEAYIEKRFDARYEVSFFWIDQLTGVKCKGRADILTPGHVMDVKKTGKSIYDFVEAIKMYRLHRQMAFYLDGLATLDYGDMKLTRFSAPFYWAAVECHNKAPKPYPNEIFQASRSDYDLGKRSYQHDLVTLARCRETGVWPKLKKKVRQISLPERYILAAHAELDVISGVARDMKQEGEATNGI